MARILAVGNVTLDIINVVDSYPAEDNEVRARSQRISRGGNAGNTLVVLSQLGHDVSWAGTLADEPDAEPILDDLLCHKVETRFVHTVARGKVPTSYVTLNRLNGSRTIIHYRDLPEYPHDDFAAIDLARFDWIHFEGRNIQELRQMLAHLRRTAPNLRCSLEVEKPRAGIEVLFSQVDALFFSSDYARHCGYNQAEAFLEALSRRGLSVLASCTWGDEGAFGLGEDGSLHRAPAFPPPAVIDTLGAGDVFNAGMIDALVRGQSLEAALTTASRLAGKKCGQRGLRNLVA